MLVRIGLLSDVHYGSDTEFQKGSRAAHLLRDFCVRMGEFKPQFIVDLGGIALITETANMTKSC